MTQHFQIKRFKGKEILPFISDLAKLRIEVFKEYPYLYVGNMEYETEYLNTYTSCPESVMALVYINNKVVGVSTAIPLEFETAECKQPLIEHAKDIKKIFYLGESVLLPQYRGHNIYRHFFHERETAAQEYGSKITAFCAVERDPHDPRRPKEYMPLDNVWRHFGYEKHPELCAYYEWKEIGEKTESKKPLIFWLKNL